MHTGPGFANGSVVWVVVGSVAAVRSAHQLVAKLAVGRPVPVLVLGVHVEVFPRDAFVWRCHLNDLGRVFCRKRVRLTQRLFVYLLCEEEVLCQSHNGEVRRK